MDQLSSHEDPRLEARPPKVAGKPRVSRLPSGTGSTRMPRTAGKAGRQSHDEPQALHRMDAAIQRDLQNQREDLTGQMAALLLESDGAFRITDLADLLSHEPGNEAFTGFLSELGDEELAPESLLQALADFAISNDAISNVMPVAAVISLQSLSPFEGDRSVDELVDLVDSLREASSDLAEIHGPEAMVVMPRILRVIHHHAQRSRLQPAELPAAIRRITHQVAASGPMVQRLLQQQPRHDPDLMPSAPSSQGAAAASTNRIQRLVIERPAEITIRYLN